MVNEEKGSRVGTNDEQMSLPRMILMFFFCFTLSIGLLSWSSPQIFDWIQTMLYEQPVLIFSKKLITLFGCGIFLFIFSFRIVVLKGKPYQLDKFYLTVIVVCLFLAFIFPSIMASVVESYVKDNHYGYCAGASFKGQDCYTIDEPTCRIETAKREQMLKDFWGEE